MKWNSNPNRKGGSFIDNLDEEKWSTIPGLKELALKAISHIQRDKGWAGHIFAVDSGRIHGILLYKKSLPSVSEQGLLADDSNNSCKRIGEAIANDSFKNSSVMSKEKI
jgi:hypothetical protein